LPNSPRLKKARQVCSNVMSMLIVFFDIQGTVHKEFIPAGQTVSGKFYCEVFEAAGGGHLAQTSRQVEKQQLVSPP
jgi:hypothetical protein